MHNQLLDNRSANDIDQFVTKILADMGDPEPPIHLEVIRDLLELDLAYYSSKDSSAISETVHRLRLSGKQVLKRPTLLIDAIRKWDLKALWVPDRKRILMDSELPPIKQRWGEAHEIGHSIIPWHDVVLHGDKKRTLSLACEQQVEAEANYAAGRILFPKDIFLEYLHSSDLNFKLVQSLGKVFGNSMTTTLWRIVESSERPVFGLVSQHPLAPLKEKPLRYFVRSPAFLNKFGEITALKLFNTLQQFCNGSRGPIGENELIFTDMNGENHLFKLEVFFNNYDALTLGTHIKKNSRAITI